MLQFLRSLVIGEDLGIVPLNEVKLLYDLSLEQSIERLKLNQLSDSSKQQLSFRLQCFECNLSFNELLNQCVLIFARDQYIISFLGDSTPQGMVSVLKQGLCFFEIGIHVGKEHGVA